MKRLATTQAKRQKSLFNRPTVAADPKHGSLRWGDHVLSEQVLSARLRLAAQPAPVPPLFAVGNFTALDREAALA
jgi:hypothetical protein